MEIREFDFRQARPGTYQAVSAFLDRLRAERDPDDPPIPLEERIRRWQHMPAYIGFQGWTIWHPERPEVIAEAELIIRRAEDNRHIADMNVAVLPEFRRQGLGRRLLAPVAAAAERERRTLLVTTTHSTIPAGDAFMRALGATMGLPLHINQLELSEVDPALLDRWQQRAAERAAGFDLMIWEGRVPEEHLEAFARLIGAMNQAPRGDLRVEDFEVTPEHIRLHEQAEAARGDQHWRIIARERGTGALAGYTEVIWHPNRPELLQQGDTAVLSTYQNLGLGRWLKAAMLAKVLEQRPQVRRIRTGNAFVNAPMLKINRELGFRPYRSMSIWQVDVNQLLASWIRLGSARRDASSRRPRRNTLPAR